MGLPRGALGGLVLERRSMPNKVRHSFVITHQPSTRWAFISALLLYDPTVAEGDGALDRVPNRDEE
jgi:hypothetical protein